ncbi:MAG: nitronate monooxygenase [Dysgonamonadaceae bacterium]|jgi:enoyl-[acyl-carrier protein] reductase II|nr:nitronate monooxygenase [Dysgonamonadaceae bacterium]
MENKITNLLKVKYPIIQGGMVWCCGWQLASAVSNNGGLGLLGAGSMTPELLREHIIKCKAATDKPFGVNVPLIYREVEKIMQVIEEEGVKTVFSSAGNPKTWTQQLKDRGIIVVHVVSSSKFAQKAEEAGVDAIVAEGFEAGGHNGKEETTTMTLIPQVRRATNLPLIAAGGIATGAGLLAAMSLGADGVQIGTRFALSEESSADFSFKKRCVELQEGDTLLALKKLSPTRMVKNPFFDKVKEAEDRGASAEELLQLLGSGRSKLGIFEGNLTEGELEIGQIASLIDRIEPVKTIMKQIVDEYNRSLSLLSPIQIS